MRKQVPGHLVSPKDHSQVGTPGHLSGITPVPLLCVCGDPEGQLRVFSFPVCRLFIWWISAGPMLSLDGKYPLDHLFSLQ